ncbi:unnamed protein product [Ectocarpus sp. 12 AP-2014]
MNALKKLAWTLLKWPLKTLYKKGPRLLYLWEGLSEENICYELTKIDALFWSSSEDSMSACDELITRKFEAFVVAVYGLIFAYLAYTLFCIKVYEYVARCSLNALLENENKALTVRDKDEVSKTKS